MKKILLVLGGRFHEFEKCGAILKRFMEASGQFEVESTSDLDRLRSLPDFDAVMVYACMGELSAEQEESLTSYVRDGGGFAGLHCATVSFRDNHAYSDMIGLEFVEHGGPCNLSVKVLEDADDVLPRVSKEFVIFDEFYRHKEKAGASLRNVANGQWQFEPHPLAHVREYGEGRVFYTALGHDERAFNHADFQDLVYKGLRYVTRQEEVGPIRFGLVGYGPLYGMGKRHGGDIRATHGLALTAVCDKDPARLEAAKEELEGEFATFTDAREMARSGEIDAGVAIVPHSVHHPVAKTLLEAGLHVVIEKPFAITVKECDELIGLARDKGVMLSVYHSRHWDPDIWTIKQIVDAGTIGEVFSIEVNAVRFQRPSQQWRSHKPISGGLMYDMGAHYFEKIFRLLPKHDTEGRPINRRATLFGNFMKRKWWGVTNEDFCRAYVRFDSGLEAQVVQSNICAGEKPAWYVAGTKGSIVAKGRGNPIEVTTVADDGRTLSTHVPMVEGISWQAFYKNVADHLLAGMPLIITPGLARATIQCIEGCERASRENRLVEMDFDLGP